MTPFQVCWLILTDVNIQTNKSPNDMSMMSNFKEYFEEVFELDTAGYQKWWSRLHSRTDIPGDDIWEIESYQDEFHLLLNLRDNLRKSGILGEKDPSAHSSVRSSGNAKKTSDDHTLKSLCDRLQLDYSNCIEEEDIKDMLVDKFYDLREETGLMSELISRAQKRVKDIQKETWLLKGADLSRLLTKIAQIEKILSSEDISPAKEDKK